MRIGLDVRLALGARRGMGTYAHQLAQRLPALRPDWEFVYYADRAPGQDDLPRRANVRVRVLRPGFYPLWEQGALPWAVRRDRPALLHCPGNTAPLWPLAPTRLLVTVHDVMYLLPASQLPWSPSLYQRLGRSYRRAIVPRAVRQAARVVCDSAHSRQDLLAQVALDPARVRVVHLASERQRTPVDPETGAAVWARYGLQAPFILAFGGLDPRKNTRRLIRAFGQVAARHKALLQLLMLGLGPADTPALVELAERVAGPERVRFPGFVPEADLPALYAGAALLLYPSLYEGFGLPVLDAMALGTPVVASATSSIPEIAGEAALLIDPTSEAAIAEATLRVLGEPALRQTLRERGCAQAGRFSWEQTAAQTLAVYEQVLRR